MKHLKKLFHFSTLKSQIIATVMLSSLILVGLSTFLFTSYGIKNIKESLEKEVSTISSMVSRRNAAALSFSNSDFSNKSLSNLSEVPEITSACLLDSQGNVFGTYQKYSSNCEGVAPPNTGVFEERQYFTEDRFVSVKNVFSNGSLVGRLKLEASTAEINEYIRDQIMTALVIMVAILMFSYLITLRLHRLISSPIMDVVEITNSVSKMKDYSMRAPEAQYAELSVLIGAFNEILSQREELIEIVSEENQAATRAYLATKYNLESAKNNFRQADDAMFVVSNILEDKLLGNKIENYLPYINDLGNSVKSYKNQMEAFQDLSNIYERTLSEDRQSIDVRDVVNHFTTIWNKENSENEVLLTDKILGAVNRNIYVEPLYESFKIIFEMITNIYGNSSGSFKFELLHKVEENESSRITFNIDMEAYSDDADQHEEQIIAQTQFYIDCVKYLSIVNNISIQFLPSLPSLKIILYIPPEEASSSNVISLKEKKRIG